MIGSDLALVCINLPNTHSTLPHVALHSSIQLQHDVHSFHYNVDIEEDHRQGDELPNMLHGLAPSYSIYPIHYTPVCHVFQHPPGVPKTRYIYIVVAKK